MIASDDSATALRGDERRLIATVRTRLVRRTVRGLTRRAPPARTWRRGRASFRSRGTGASARIGSVHAPRFARPRDPWPPVPRRSGRAIRCPAALRSPGPGDGADDDELLQRFDQQLQRGQSQRFDDRQVELQVLVVRCRPVLGSDPVLKAPQVSAHHAQGLIVTDVRGLGSEGGLKGDAGGEHLPDGDA